MNTEQIQRIKDNQKFLLKLLHLHIGNYYPLRRWLGIDYTGKIDEISHLSYGYNTEYFKKGGKWYKKQTRVYQQPDLGYKLNLLLNKIPQLSFALPALLQPSYSFLWLLAFGLTTTTYQPTTADNTLYQSGPNDNHGSDTEMGIAGYTGYKKRTLLYFDISDIPSSATFTQGDIGLYTSRTPSYTAVIIMNRLTRTNWTENGSTWNKYDGTNAWTTAGGDYTTTNSVSINSDTSVGWRTWNASALIQDCYDNQSKKVHLLAKTNEPGTVEDEQWYWSREYTTDTSKRPKLSITYLDATAAYSTLSLSSNVRFAGEIDSQSSLSLSTTLEPNRWKKDNTHTQTWVKEQTHDKMYKS